jgi:predicted TIM-barrel fold metal-dependent hydrolase
MSTSFQSPTMGAIHVSEAQFDELKPLPYKPISADSHVTEPPNCYTDYIDPKYRDVAPHMIANDKGGAQFVVDGMAMKIGMGGLAAAGVDPKEIKLDTASFDEIHRGGWDPKARVAEQEVDGVGGEIVYPSVGMLICNHPDADYKKACFDAYNRWLQDFQGGAPDRIFGVGQTAVRSVEETIEDLRRIKEMGFWGVMMPCDPSTEFDYDDKRFDPLWQAAIELKLPLSFHILTSQRDTGILGMGLPGRSKGKANMFQGLIRANQDAISLFIWGGIFERFPELKMVCVEADAGWAPHFMYRMDHFYRRHRFHAGNTDLPRLPSEYFRENVYLTFQDDLVAFNTIELMNPRRLLWANDFPHSDSTWPWSQQMLARQTQNMSDEVRRMILRDNVAELYNLPVEDDDLLITEKRVVTL